VTVFSFTNVHIYSVLERPNSARENTKQCE